MKKYKLFFGIVLVGVATSGCGPVENKSSASSEESMSGGAWLNRLGTYTAKDDKYKVGAIHKTLTLQKEDFYSYGCLQFENGTCSKWGKKDVLKTELEVVFKVQENNFLSKNISGKISFDSQGKFLSNMGKAVILTKTGELLVKENRAPRYPDFPPDSLYQEDRFRVTAGKLLGVERSFDERGETVIYEREMPFVRTEE